MEERTLLTNHISSVVSSIQLNANDKCVRYLRLSPNSENDSTQQL
jgi:hypothetical protein